MIQRLKYHILRFLQKYAEKIVLDENKRLQNILALQKQKFAELQAYAYGLEYGFESIRSIKINFTPEGRYAETENHSSDL